MGEQETTPETLSEIETMVAKLFLKEFGDQCIELEPKKLARQILMYARNELSAGEIVSSIDVAQKIARVLRNRVHDHQWIYPDT